MSGADRAWELAALLREHGVPEDAIHGPSLAFIAVDSGTTEAVKMWIRAIARHPDDERAATLAGVLLASGVPTPALTMETVRLLSCHEDAAKIVELWAILIADYHLSVLRRAGFSTGTPDAGHRAGTVWIGPHHLADDPSLELWSAAMTHDFHAHTVAAGYVKAQLRASHVMPGDLDEKVINDVAEEMGAEHTQILGALIRRAFLAGAALPPPREPE